MTKDKTSKWVSSITFSFLMAFMIFSFSNCKPDEPEKENVEEVISKITVHFTPTVGGTTISVSAVDPDGDGPQDIEAEGPINLEYNLEYDMEIEFVNHLATPEEDITEEIRVEGNDHMIFFGWTTGLFFSPSNGDINTNRENVRYQDEDTNGLPIGLQTKWTTANQDMTGDLRIVLKHQPDLKSASSTVSTGSTEVDVSFGVVVAK